MNPARLLVADDERHIAEGLQLLLGEAGYSVDMAVDGNEAWDKVSSGEYGVVLTDLKMPGMDGLELFARMREHGIESEVIIITGKGSVSSAVDAMRHGAYDYLTKPLDLERLNALIPKALEKYDVNTANRRLRERLERLTRYAEMVGHSERMRELYGVIEAVAPSNASVLIIGESGTGKELVARAIHNKSDRKKGEFIAVNCGALPREILENELFGHEKGAFTGATNEKPGCFELAHGGTLFLDEVAEMESDTQVKLLRALEQRSFRRLGGKKEIRVDIRVISATNKNVADALRDGKLREDVYHRLAVVPLTLPPLREREGDARLLAEDFLQRFAREHGKRHMELGEDALSFIQSYHWPGNVRELKNAIERAVILAGSERIGLADLRPRELTGDERHVFLEVGSSLADAERLVVLKTFAFTGGNKEQTATILGIPEDALRERLLRYMDGPVPVE